jgi:hypothetical protein
MPLYPARPFAVTIGGTGTSTAFTAGSVVYAGASGVYTQSNSNLFFDGTNLGIGTAVPSTKADIQSGLINIGNSGADGSLTEVFRIGLAGNTGTSNWRHSIYSSLSSNSALAFLKFSIGSNQTTQVDVLTLRASGAVGIGITTPTSLLDLYGGTLTLSNTSTVTQRAQADLVPSWVVSTDASRTARAVLNVYDTAAREIMRGEASGTAAMVGFLGAAAVVRQTVTGSKGANAALTSLLAALAALGLITDSSS